MAPSTVSIRKLKEFAYEKLPRNSFLRELLLWEKDELTVTEYIAKISVWLKLFRKEVDVEA